MARVREWKHCCFIITVRYVNKVNYFCWQPGKTHTFASSMVPDSENWANSGTKTLLAYEPWKQAHNAKRKKKKEKRLTSVQKVSLMFSARMFLEPAPRMVPAAQPACQWCHSKPYWCSMALKTPASSWKDTTRCLDPSYIGVKAWRYDIIRGQRKVLRF